MKTHKIMILLAGMLFFGVTAMAQQAPPPPNRPGFGNGQHMIQMLNLTQDQQTKLSDMRLAMQKQMLPLRNKMLTLRSDLKLQLTADKFDQGKVNQIVNQITDVRKQMSLNRIGHMRSVRNLLNPDQQKTFDLMVMSRRKGGFMNQRPRRNSGNRGMRSPQRPARSGLGMGPCR